MRLFRGPVHYGRELPGYPFELKELVTRAIIVLQRKFYGEMLKTRRVAPLAFTATEAADVQRLLSETLWADGSPKLVARFGTGEMETALRHLDIAESGPFPWKFLKMLGGRIGPFWWDNSIRSGIHWIAGVFPPDNATFDRFSEIILDDAGLIDSLGGWIAGETRLRDAYFPGATAFPIHSMLRPDCPVTWTSGLKGKKVLVVSPFADSIREQYARRERLFANPEMLPAFDLRVMKPVVSHAGAFVDCGYPDWVSALEAMKREMDALDYDVALVSAGAYGLSLAAHAKRCGKKAVHMGGVLQILFGIRGARYDARSYWPQFFNECWVRPKECERPKSYKTVEGGSYW